CNIEVAYDSIPGSGWAVGPASDPQTSDWLFATPQWFRHAMKEIHKRWPTNKIMLSEFGFTQPFEGSRVRMRFISLQTTLIELVHYFMSYLSELLLSINEDGIPLAGAFAWAMVDNSEWTSGESARFGIQHVNYSTPMLDRTFKRSALALCEFPGSFCGIVHLPKLLMLHSGVLSSTFTVKDERAIELYELRNVGV
ncbi:glycoside hydrolase, partial [Gymnopus androsaceus JB14]